MKYKGTDLIASWSYCLYEYIVCIFSNENLHQRVK